MVKLDDMRHRTKRRAPSIIGRVGMIIGMVAIFNWAIGDWTRTDTDVLVGMVLAAAMVYFHPPEVIKYDTFTTPVTWKEWLGRFF